MARPTTTNGIAPLSPRELAAIRKLIAETPKLLEDVAFLAQHSCSDERVDDLERRLEAVQRVLAGVSERLGLAGIG